MFEKSPTVVEAAAKLTDDQDPRVRLQLALSLGEWNLPAAGAALAKVASGRESADRYFGAAVSSSAVAHFQPLTDAVVASKGDFPVAVSGGLARMAAKRGENDTMQHLLWAVMQPLGGPFSADQLNVYFDCRDITESKGAPFGSVGDVGVKCEAYVVRDDTPLDVKVAASRIFGRRPDPGDFELRVLKKMLSPRSAPELQIAAVAAFGRMGGEVPPRVLLETWQEHSPDLRGRIVDVLLKNEASAAKLLDAVEAKRVSAAEIDLPRRQRLLNHKDKAIKDRAAKLLAESAVGSNRQKVLDAWRPVIEMKGDTRNGKEMFRQHCAVCHHLLDQGQEVGPNLETVREWTGEQVLTSILDPGRQTEPKYIAYTATTGAGETIFGVIAAESGNAVTMKGLDGKERAVLRGDLKSLVSSNRSLMPDGFESAMTKQQMADLMEFLKAPERAR